MKKFLLFAVSFFSMNFLANAQQTTQKISLAKDQQLKFVSTVKGKISQESMSMNVDMKMDILSKKTIDIKTVNKDHYLANLTTTRLKMDMLIADQKNNFDSEKKEDMSGDMKEFGKDINVPKKYELSFNNQSKALEVEQPTVTDKSSNNNPMSALMDQMVQNSNEDDALESYFMLIPANKKKGDSWQDSTITTENSKYITYQWDSLTNDIAVIKVVQKINNKVKAELMGMDVETNVTNDIDEIRRVNISTGIIEYKSSISKLSGTAEVMGISMPLTGKVESSTILE